MFPGAKRRGNSFNYGAGMVAHNTSTTSFGEYLFLFATLLYMLL